MQQGTRATLRYNELMTNDCRQIFCIQTISVLPTWMKVKKEGGGTCYMNSNERCYFNEKKKSRLQILLPSSKNMIMISDTRIFFNIPRIFIFFVIPIFINAAMQHDATRRECCHLSTMHTLVSVAGAKSVSLYRSTILHQLRNLLRKIFFFFFYEKYSPLCVYLYVFLANI